MEKIPNDVGDKNSAPKLTVFFVTPPEQGDMEVEEQGQPQWKYITAQLCRAWGEDCAWQMCFGALLMTLANHSGSVWVWVCEEGDPGVVLPGSITR